MILSAFLAWRLLKDPKHSVGYVYVSGSVESEIISRASFNSKSFSALESSLIISCLVVTNQIDATVGNTLVNYLFGK